jgi:ribose/xylose/arabinose/galactoside ABC-type transport system permease subunit
MLISAAVLLPAVVAMQFLLILGRFDLSAGAMAALAGMIAGVTVNHTGSLLVGLAVGSAAGVLGGAITGVTVARFGVDPLVATLAMTGVERSLALVSNGSEIVTGIPDSFGWLSNGRVLGMPVLVMLAVALTGIAAAAAQHLVTFRRFYAVGSNEKAALHAGVNGSGLLVLGYSLVGLGSATTGLIQVSRTLSASPLTFQTLPIDVITACILGGGSLAGGKGGILGATVGLIAVVATDNLVIMLGVENDWKDFAVGALLLVVVIWRPAVSALRQAWFRSKSQIKTER